MLDGAEAPLFPGVFAIFGHGNVTGLGLALQAAQDELPTWRGQNEQGMALAADRPTRRRCAAGRSWSRRRRSAPAPPTWSPPPAWRMANRLPVLLLSGDTFQSRLPDPVLQQVEHFGAPSTTVNDAFRAVVRYWDRITRPEQVLQSLPLAVATLLDPADCGPAFLGLPQDVQAEAYDYPEPLLRAASCTSIAAPRPDRDAAGRRAADAAARRAAAAAHRRRRRPLRRWPRTSSGRFAEAPRRPVVETVAGKAALRADHPCRSGRSASPAADPTNALAAEADVVLAVGTRLQDFTTGSWTVFARRGAAARRAQRRPLRRGEAPRVPVRRRRPRGARELGARARRLARRRRLGGRAPRGAAAPWTAIDAPRGPDRRRAADVRAGGRRRQPAGDARRLRADRGRRLPGRAERQLALAGGRHVRLRVRLLVHGLRDRRRPGGRGWPDRDARRDRRSSATART